MVENSGLLGACIEELADEWSEINNSAIASAHQCLEMSGEQDLLEFRFGITVCAIGMKNRRVIGRDIMITSQPNTSHPKT